MKLRNRKTGEIGHIDRHYFHDKADSTNLGMNMGLSVVVKGKAHGYRSLAELNEEWEDYEEPEKPKMYWYINRDGHVGWIDAEYAKRTHHREYDFGLAESVGNLFETKEEAERAVEKLKAWKRLRDKKFKFTGVYPGRHEVAASEITFLVDGSTFCDDENVADLQLLFGGEE